MSVPAASAMGSSKHIVLVHGTGHGAWCWYKVATLLRSAGYRVTALDLAASGIDARQLHEAPTIADYTRPLLDILRGLPPEERVVLVGHSYGGVNIALAAEMFPEKIAAAVFVTAFLPDCTSPPSHVVQKLRLSDWMDTMMNPNDTPASIAFGPQILRQLLYQLCSPEDLTLCQALLRAGSYYVPDLQSHPPLSMERYGSVSKVYVVCKQDLMLVEDFQRWMIGNFSVTEVKEIAAADHMAMLSAPQELSRHIADAAEAYA